jgi:hypothetical protein
MLQLLTPQLATASAGGRTVRLLLAGVTVSSILLSSIVALGALGLLLSALFVLYFLLTKVLGLRLDVDPSAFVAEAQRYAAQYGFSN